MCCPLVTHHTSLPTHMWFLLCVHPMEYAATNDKFLKKIRNTSSVFCQIFWDTWVLQIFQRSAVQDLQKSSTSVQFFVILGACNVFLSRLNDVSRKMPQLVPIYPLSTSAPPSASRDISYTFFPIGAGWNTLVCGNEACHRRVRVSCPHPYYPPSHYSHHPYHSWTIGIGLLS